MVRNLPANAGDAGSIPGSGRSPEEGNGNPLQYSCLENPMDQKKKKQTEPGGLQSLGHKESDITERTRRGLKALPCHWRLCGFRALRRPVWLTLLLGAQCQPPPLFLFSFGSLGRCQPPATTPGHTAAPSSFSLFFKLIFIGV